MKELTKMSVDELLERQQELAAEIPQEQRDALTTDEIEERAKELEAIKAELEARKEANRQAEAERQKVAEGAGTVIKDFKQEDKRMNCEINSPEYRDAFLRNLQGKELTAEERAALSGGGYAIPQETANKVWGKMELYPLLNAIDVMHIPGTVVLPVEGTVNDAAVVAMGTAATDSADSIGSVSLGIYKLIKTIEITADVAAMAVPAFEDWLVNRLANKLYRLVSKLVASGSGSSTVTGLSTITAMSADYTAAGITYDDVLAIIAELPSEYLPGASFTMSRETFWTGIMAIKDDNDRPIVVADAQSPAKYNILGYPVIIEDELGTDIVFGDLKEGYVFNFGKDPTVDRDTSVGFRSGSTVFRVLALGDGKPTGVGLVRCEQGT